MPLVEGEGCCPERVKRRLRFNGITPLVGLERGGTRRTAMRLAGLFKGVRYIGVAKGNRKTYSLFETDSHYLVLGPSRDGYYLNLVNRRAPGLIAKGFSGRKVTTKQVSQRLKTSTLLPDRLAALSALYVMVALGRAQKLKQRQGKAFVFKIK